MESPSVDENDIDTSTDEYTKCKLHLSSSNGLKIGHLNVRSLSDKIDEVRFIIFETNLDIFCISETWLKDDINDDMIHIPGYTVVRRDRNCNKRGGGVCIYIRSNISFVYRNDFHNDVVEAVWIELPRTNSDKIIVGSLYRPPNADTEYFKNMIDILEIITSEGNEVIVLGDMNYDYKHDEYDPVNPIVEIEDLFLMKQIISEPTRVTEKSSKCLDHILTTMSECHNVCGVCKTSVSDHYLIYTSIESTRTKNSHNHVRFRDYKNFDSNLFIDDIKQCKALSDTDISKNSLEIKWNMWKTAFLNISDRHAPFRQCRVKRRHNPWMTQSIIQLIYKRDYLKKKHLSTRSPKLLKEYRHVRNEITKEIRRCKKEYFDIVANKYKNNSKALWKELDRIRGGNKHESQIPSDLSNDTLNDFFVNVGKQITKSFNHNIFEWFHPKCIHSFKFTELDPQKILASLSKLNSESNIDILDFDSKLLNIAAPFIYHSLCALFNESLKTGQVPNDWKIGRITPIYKGKGSKSDPTNYRPISVVGHVGKIVEREVHTQFLNFLRTNDLINIDQFAFLPNHSTQTCLHRVSDEWFESFNLNELIAACFLDISKCFDCIDIELLLLKLTYYGVEECEHKWFSNYLHDRSQAVYCHGSLSAFQNVNVGVPQGSILAPLLFLLYMNDISQCLKFSRCNIYADDVVIYTSSPNFTEAALHLQADLDRLSYWYTKNKLKINIDKTKVMLLSPSKNYNLEIFIDKQIIEQVHNIRYLGVEIDDRLKWNNHTRQLIKTISYKIFTLSKMRKFINKDVLNMLYFSLVQPIIDYACSVWGQCSNNAIDKLSRLQKRAARVVTGNFDYTSSHGEVIVRDLKWQSFQQRRDYFIATMMFKCIHGLAPTHMINELEMVCERHAYSTRNAESLNVVVPKPNLECFKRSFRFSGAKVWNSLPNNLQNLQSVNSFKQLYKHMFFK